MAQIIKDTLSIMSGLTTSDEIAKRKHGLPCLKGVLYQQLVDANGEPIFKKINENTVTLGGACITLQKLFGNAPSYMPPTINELEGINDTVDGANAEGTHVLLFGVGIGGCGMTVGDVKDPDFKSKELIDWIPFRISDTEELEISDTDPSKYYFRKQISPDPAPQWGWYLKEFDNTVIPKSLWKDVPDPDADGTEVTSDVSGSDSENLIECFGECLIKLEEEDLRPFFQWAGNLKLARYNSIGLFTGTKKQITPGYVDYVGIRLFSVVNFNNVPLDLPSTATYLYRVYAAV